MASTIYGPVRSWRFGWSLGVDLILTMSACSFDCVYCQLGPIQLRTARHQRFVSTERVLSDLEKHDWQRADVVAFSGSGEPTLAANLGEAIGAVAAFTHLPTVVLTNGTLLGNRAVGQALIAADRVEVKLDAATETIFRRINRPVDGVTLSRIVEATAAFRGEYGGHLSVQVMVMPMNRDDLEGLVHHLRRISPDSICLNTPRRPRPSHWYLAARGSHGEVPYPARPMRQPTGEECLRLAKALADGTRVAVWLDAGERTVVTAKGTRSRSSALSCWWNL